VRTMKLDENDDDSGIVAEGFPIVKEKLPINA
jgi:hypothetical protein